MLTLNDSLYFAEGYVRKCYLHPDDNNLCVKIPHKNQNERQRGICKSIQREKNYYKSLIKRGIAWDHLCQYHGDIETNLGLGSVYEIIRDHNGEIAQNLEQYLSQADFFQNHESELVKALQELLKYMLENKILTTSLRPRNIVLDPVPDNFKLSLIDDIGNSEWLKVSELTSGLQVRKIKRKWRAMFKEIETKYIGSSYFLEQKVLGDVTK